MSEEEFRQLTSEIEGLRNQLASTAANAEIIAELKANMAGFDEKVALLERMLALSDRFAKIEIEHNSWKTLARYVSITAGLAALIFGWLGFKSFDNFVHSEVDKRFSFYSDLSAGLAYHDKYPASAIPYLMRCFDERPFEEPIVASLLFASDEADMWDTGQIVLDRLGRDPTKSSTFRDPITYNLIGLAALNLGFTDPSRYPYAHRSFDQGLRIVNPDNSYALWYLRFNLWRLLLATGDPQANPELATLRAIERPPDLNSWEKAKEWKWYKVLRDANPGAARIFEEGYRSLLPTASSRSASAVAKQGSKAQ